MFRTARIKFADHASGTERTLTAQVFHDPAYNQFWQDDAVAEAVERCCHLYGGFGIIGWAWVN